MSDGSIHMQQLDRGEINLFPFTAYMSLFLIVSEIYMDVKSRNVEKFVFFLTFWPTL